MEEDDLEFLRMAALKSLQSKKSQNKEKVGNAIKVVESIAVPSATVPYFAPANHPTTGSRIQTLVIPNDNSSVNEPYLPQRRDAIAPWTDTEYGGPYGVAVPSSRTMLPNVQLSPRSAAFVSQNNDILNRRKGHAASPERDRSRSPITPPSRYTPARWSVSPPPYKHVNTRPHYENRSGSRSPIHREKSPQIYRRSPLPNSKSPPQLSRKSRSPPQLKVRKSPLRKSLSGSPHRTATDRHPPSPYSRNRSPAGRYSHSQKGHRRYSPSQSRSYNRKQLARRSLSPRNNGHQPIKRSKSPINSKRSRSRSPNKNVASRPSRNERLIKRRSPLYNRKNNSNRGSNRSKRKLTPPQSPTNKKKVEKTQNAVPQSGVDKKPSPTVEKNKTEKTTDTTTDKPEPTSEKSTESVENEMSASSDDDKSSDEEDDGIDLFASEESESENEGRFKSNSSKNARSNTAATVSFSKLGNATASTLGELNEVKADRNSSSSHREDRYKRGSNYSSRKDDRSKKYGSSRNEDSRYGDSSRSSYKSRYVSSTASAVTKVVEEKKKDEKSMFKSTFQVLPSEMKSEAVKSTSSSKPILSSRVSPIKEKAGDKKLIVLKRPAESTVDDPIDEETDKLPSSVGDNAKKSIHARLGAPTKTWKNKKSWRTEKL
ncbi:serine/arginine repetitive matrix protein 2-like isoform X3 [Bradysia coprophila]|uniref:serine/arginine repetitive matrix protein 2-like isoform X3 n=1 Tax=Bradysia coprophila TaxID=38358 RepID=UPI00187D8E67|nr:serine/arginine repetitive matrix protein 2-like isoform X3 [Bradysia coprophila]